MVLIFNGQVTLGDACRCSEEGPDGSIFIGGIDVVSKIRENKENFRRKVTVGILDERFDGELFIEEGWGYSEWTPMDNDQLKVGSHDLIEIVTRYSGQSITMFVADEPVNILDAEFTEVPKEE